MSDFSDPSNGKLGSVGRAVTMKEAPGKFQEPNYCSLCGVPGPCPGHYANPVPSPVEPTQPPAYQPTPFKVGQ